MKEHHGLTVRPWKIKLLAFAAGRRDTWRGFCVSTVEEKSQQQRALVDALGSPNCSLEET
jgi:hypothetical protein